MITWLLSANQDALSPPFSIVLHLKCCYLLWLLLFLILHPSEWINKILSFQYFMKQFQTDYFTYYICIHLFWSPQTYFRENYSAKKHSFRILKIFLAQFDTTWIFLGPILVNHQNMVNHLNKNNLYLLLCVYQCWSGCWKS